MSVKLRFESSSDGGPVQRSRSFTGFGSLNSRQRSSLRNSFCSKAITRSKSPRMHLSPHRGSAGVWCLQPEQVDRVFVALSRGLKDYLETHQAEMEFLTSQQRDTKRNSRLGFLYDLEKEIKALERYIRRLEFQISKVDELYETYCVQWRLSQGALNMKRAFSLSPSSRGSRESLLELNKNHRHSLQEMSVMEADLEILLGELHVKMKGLIGFARLCPGDQYEVQVRLGRQRWRTRGRIQSDDCQLWDEEETVFLPHIHHNFEIKVTESRGLGWLLVGMVTCASADFFVVKPQMMVVDITELGTIKLQLEVTWSPLDSVDRLRPLSISRQSVSSRKTVHSWTAPSTPSFSEKYFLSMVRQLQHQDSSLPSLLSHHHNRGDVSLISYLSKRPLTPSLTRTHSFPFSHSPGPSLGGSLTQLWEGEEEEAEEEEDREEFKKVAAEEEWGGGPLTAADKFKAASVEALQRCSTPDILRKNAAGETGDQRRSEQVSREYVAAAPPTPCARPPAVTPTPVAPPPGRAGVGGAQRGALSLRLGSLMVELEEALQSQRCWEKELRSLDQQVLHLATILKNNLSILRRASSQETLAVEEVLGSFDFLSHDFSADDDTSCVGSLRLQDSGISSFQQSPPGILSQDSQSASEEEQGITPLTSGNWDLDRALETHLNICCVLLQTIKTTDFAPSRKELLEDVSHQADVLDRVSCFLLEKKDVVSAADILPEVQKSRDLLLFWDECMVDSSCPFCCHVDSFSRALRKRYTHKVKCKRPGQSERVFSQLLQQVQAPSRVIPCHRSVSSQTDSVTIFQLSVYLKRWSVQDLGGHVSRLSREEFVLSTLVGPKRRKALNRLKRRDILELLPLGITLQTLAVLQLDSNHRVCRAASSCICRAASCKNFRSKALVYYTENLKSSDAATQQSCCLALRCLRATESVDLVADLWRSVDEDVRTAAKETVLSFGKKGFEAFQRMDQLCAEMEEEAYRNLETEITVL